MPSTMQAVVIESPRRAVVRETPIPRLDTGQVRVKLEGCGVCASNIPPWEGRAWFDYPMAPGGLGHEGWGFIDAVADNVTDLKPGDRVAMLSEHAYAEYDVAPSEAVVKLPAALNGRPFPAEPLACAINILRRSRIQANQTTAIVGIGFLGALLTQMAARAGARVIAVNRRAAALSIARSMGAAHALAMDDRTIEHVRQLTDTHLCPVVIEATGKQQPLDLAAELTGVRGRLVIAGYHQDGLRHCNLQLWNWRGIDVINAHERDLAVYRNGMESAVVMTLQGSLDPSPLYTHRFPLSRLDEALNMARQRPDGFMKAWVEINPEESKEGVNPSQR